VRRTLPELLTAAMAEPDAPALRTPTGIGLSYGQLGEDSRQLALALGASGVRVGDRVAYQVDKSAAAVVLHVALLNPGYPDAEVDALLADAEPALVIRSPERSPLNGPWRSLTMDVHGDGSVRALADDGFDGELPSVTAADGAALLYTSGTTGRPKGALLSHGNLAANAQTLVEAWEFTPSDVLLHMLPLFHTHGLFVATHCALTSGASMVLLPTFDVDEVLAALPSCSVVMGVPTHYVRLLGDERFGSPLCDGVRLFVSGSAPMTRTTHASFAARTGMQILERYGMTETSMLTSNPLRGPRRPGTVGPPLPGVSVRTVDESGHPVAAGLVGSVEVRGANVFSGYWRRPDLEDEAFTADGWFRTGDLGRFDDDGYLELVGRSKDLVITGGLNVYPKDVESVLDTLPGVAESAVVGLPDADFGERVVAVVVASDDAQPEPEALRQAARSQLAGYKVPKEIVVVKNLPRNVMGKVEKAVLRDQLMDRGA
jgi:malonyl-CoA/methylmalonyl-CoA synthetase